MKQRNLSRQRPRNHRGPMLRPLAFSLMCAGLAPAMAQVMPSGFTTPAGSGVAMMQDGALMNITQQFQRGIANWQSFSIGVGGTVNITQPNASSVLLNRVTGGQMSTIAGSINANGRVILVNPSGVMFSQGATVNVGGLIASTLSLKTSDQAFMDGATNLVFEQEGAAGKSVRNFGSITANGGPVVLMGAAVENGSTGTITANGGTVGLASGGRITLDLVGDGLTNIVISPDSMAANASVDNSGTLQADGGRVALMGSSATVGELVVRQTGTVRARTLGTVNGEIFLGGGADNRVEMTGGILDATGTAAGQSGGTIRIAAGQVKLEGAGQGPVMADASGQAGGGTVSVRGYDVALGSGSVLRADATNAGTGGTVEVGTAMGYSLPGDGNAQPTRDSRVQAFGEISARGAGSGKGGEIDTSADFLRIDPTRVDAGGGAQGGANGNWRVATSSNLAVVTAADIPAYDPAYPPLSFAEVNAEAVGAALGRGTNVTLASTAIGDNAGVRFGTDAKVVKAEGGAATLRVDSAGSIVMDPGSSIDAKVGALNVDFNADSTGLVAANAATINSGGGTVTELDYAGAIRLDNATVNANGGSVRFFGQSLEKSGRAIGGSASHTEDPSDTWRDGVYLTGSTVTTHGDGQISMRGQGRNWIFTPDGSPPRYVASGGVTVDAGSTVQAGLGGVRIDGAGALGGNGVSIFGGSSVRATGDVTLAGTGGVWQEGMTVASVNSSAGVSVGSGTVASERNVRIDGTGTDLDALRTSGEFLSINGSAGIGTGVAIYGSVSAGAGQRIDVNGRAGSDGFFASGGSDGDIFPAGSAFGVDVSANSNNPNPLRTSGGTIAIDGLGTDISLRMETFGSGAFALAAVPQAGALAAVPEPALLSVMSETGKGGNISVRGRNIVIDGTDGFGDGPEIGRIDASGATGGGSIDIQAANVLAVGKNTSLEANATGSGNGGSVKVIGGDTLRGYGSISARGGAAGGNGGFVDTSAAHFDLTGVRVDASSPMGSAGTWLIDPYNVNIASGTASGSLTGNPFDPLTNSIIQDGDINAALDKGSSVTITTGTGGNAFDGNITFDKGATITRSVGGAPVTFRLDAGRDIIAFNDNQIQSNDGILNVVFNAGVGTDGGSVIFGGAIRTNGGYVAMNADAGITGSPAIQLNNTTIDTRTTASGDAGPGGFVQIAGTRATPPFSSFGATVDLNGIDIQTSTGDVSISGIGTQGAGVRIATGNVVTSQILTTSGDIDIAGVGTGLTSSFGSTSVYSVDVNNTLVRSVDGNIGIRGLVSPGALGTGSGGVLLANNALVTTLGVGNIDIAGEAQINGTGLNIATGARVDGNSAVVLRAANNGGVDAVAINGTVRAGSLLNLRPGGVDAAGNAVERTANPITLGGTAANGFAVSAAEFTRLDAPTIVAGSNAHAGDINVVGPLALSSALTLQNEGGGNINLGGAIDAPRLGLLSRGNITQTADAPITAGTLMARSTGGSVLLDAAPNNVSAATVGGGAAGAFRYVDVDTVQLGSVSVTGYDAGGNAPQLVSATSMAADTVFVRTLSGDLLLGTDVSSTSGTDLVAAARLQNLGAYAITGAPWRVWADTWIGETRGGLRGSGPLPNLYHCAYSGLCSVIVSPGDNHFIYAQQPTATVVIGNASRPFGFANPAFGYTLAGLILGDSGAGFSGVLGTTATRASLPGGYPINGSFTSAEGYAVNVVPGNLTVTPAFDFPRVDVLRDIPSTWLYDRNIGAPPICFATGAVDGDRAAQGGDVLAREWSRVRSRPNLSSCVDTEKRNGCADF
ncbi:beta strand repeat-containing protein [Variovorax boronicumulans]|uniref:beta strand repeat-containing protein n=1 Tax=Variovorax boronicumulans TaxID=436515 RepID=UPI00339A86ED